MHRADATLLPRCKETKVFLLGISFNTFPETVWNHFLRDPFLPSCIRFPRGLPTKTVAKHHNVIGFATVKKTQIDVWTGMTMWKYLRRLRKPARHIPSPHGFRILWVRRQAANQYVQFWTRAHIARPSQIKFPWLLHSDEVP